MSLELVFEEEAVFTLSRFRSGENYNFFVTDLFINPVSIFK